MPDLLDKIKEKSATICILGLGRVGLPLAAVFASKGLNVIGIDLDEKRLSSIRDGKCPFYDPALQENLDISSKSGKLTVENSLEKIKDRVDAIFVTVGTPTTLGNSVDYSQVYTALEEVCKAAGNDFQIAVCPERILEGKAVKEIQEIPEIIGGINQTSNDIVTEIFRHINPNKKFSYTTITGAELAKLFANIYRYIGFALSNELAIWAEMFGESAPDIINISNYEYARSNIPKPGFAGGPCLSKDGLFLDNNTTFSSIVSTAWKVNESIPQHVINKIKQVEGNLFGKKIGILGISFKSDSDDLRNSPSLKLVELLNAAGAITKTHDPFIKDTSSLSEVLESSEIIILATNHSKFKDIKKEIQDSKPKLIYDVWSLYGKDDFRSSKYLKLGMG